MRFRHLATLMALVLAAQTAAANEYRVEKLDEAAPADELAAEIAATLSSEGVRVIRGTSRTVCDIWLCKQWPLKSLETPQDVSYPFQSGQLIGVIRLPRRTAEFRDQDVDSGVYTLRFELQPVDGAHVGTSPTRDFLLLVKASEDKSVAPMDYKTLVAASADVAGSTHPAMLCLQRPEGKADELPSIRSREDLEWWIVRMQGTANVDGEKKPLPIEVVVVGQAIE